MTKEELIRMAAEALNDSPENMEKCCKEVEEINGYYFWQNFRGGKSVMLNGSGERLKATSAVDFRRHLEAFLAGKRN